MRGNSIRFRAGLLVLLAALLVLVAAEASAESVFGFSYFGRDERTGDARIEGRGGMGLAYTDSMNASVLQATQLADLKRVTIGLSGRFRSVKAQSDYGEVGRLGMSTPVIRMGFPLPGNGGIGFGFTANRATQWTVGRPWINTTNPADSTRYREQIEREGTLFSIPIQIGYRFFDHLAVGAGMHFQRGAVRIRYDIGTWDPAQPRIIDYRQREIREDTYSGWTPEVSLALYEIGPVSVAGYWLPEYKADVEVVQATLRDPADVPTIRKDTMPQRVGLGTRLQLPGRLSLGADFTLEQWSAYKGRTFTYDADGNYDPNGVALDMKDERALRVGFERESRRVGLRYTVPVRLGYYMRDWHYQLEGNDVSEWGVSLGSGMALLGGLSRIDYSVGYSRTGNQGDNGVTESMWTIVVSVAGGESWY